MSPPGRSGRWARWLAAVGSAPLFLLPPALRRRGGEIREVVSDVVGDAFAAGGWRAAAGAAAGQAGDLVLTAFRLRPGLRFAGPAAALLAVILLRASVPHPPFYYEELTVAAHDAAGAFTVTLRGGRLVAASLAGVPLPGHRLRQVGHDLSLMNEDGSVMLDLHFEPPGLVRWQGREP